MNINAFLNSTSSPIRMQGECSMEISMRIPLLKGCRHWRGNRWSRAIRWFYLMRYRNAPMPELQSSFWLRMDDLTILRRVHFWVWRIKWFVHCRLDLKNCIQCTRWTLKNLFLQTAFSGQQLIQWEKHMMQERLFLMSFIQHWRSCFIPISLLAECRK